MQLSTYVASSTGDLWIFVLSVLPELGSLIYFMCPFKWIESVYAHKWCMTEIRNDRWSFLGTYLSRGKGFMDVVELAENNAFHWRSSSREELSKKTIKCNDKLLFLNTCILHINTNVVLWDFGTGFNVSGCRALSLFTLSVCISKPNICFRSTTYSAF